MRLRSCVLLVKQDDGKFCACAVLGGKAQRNAVLSGCLETVFGRRACALALDATGGGAQRGRERWGGREEAADAEALTHRQAGAAAAPVSDPRPTWGPHPLCSITLPGVQKSLEGPPSYLGPPLSPQLLFRQSQHPHNPCRPPALIFCRLEGLHFIFIPKQTLSGTLEQTPTALGNPHPTPALPSDLDAPGLLHCPVGITSQHHACSTPRASSILLPCPVLLRPRSPLTPAVAPFSLPLLLISLHPSRLSVPPVPINSSARH